MYLLQIVKNSTMFGLNIFNKIETLFIKSILLPIGLDGDWTLKVQYVKLWNNIHMQMRINGHVWNMKIVD